MTSVGQGFILSLNHLRASDKLHLFGSHALSIHWESQKILAFADYGIPCEMAIHSRLRRTALGCCCIPGEQDASHRRIAQVREIALQNPRIARIYPCWKWRVHIIIHHPVKFRSILPHKYRQRCMTYVVFEDPQLISELPFLQH